jgi:hypothetical protein
MHKIDSELMHRRKSMRTTIEIRGFPELVLEKAVSTGIARSKTDALKISILIMNDKFQLVDNIKEINDSKLISAFKRKEKDMKAKGKKNITHDEVLKKYGYLLKKD